MPKVRVLPILAAVLLSVPATGATEPVQTVNRALTKVGVDKVLSVTLQEGTDPASSKTVPVLFRLLGVYPRCGEGEAFWYREGTLDDTEYISFWSAVAAAGCPAGHGVELQQVMNLEVGKAYRFVFRGPDRWDQKVSFRLDPREGVTGLMVKRHLGG